VPKLNKNKTRNGEQSGNDNPRDQLAECLRRLTRGTDDAGSMAVGHRDGRTTFRGVTRTNPCPVCGGNWP
jgi:hypothetical protein